MIICFKSSGKPPPSCRRHPRGEQRLEAMERHHHHQQVPRQVSAGVPAGHHAHTVQKVGQSLHVSQGHVDGAQYHRGQAVG